MDLHSWWEHYCHTFIHKGSTYYAPAVYITLSLSTVF